MRPHALGSSTASRRRQLVFFVADGRQSRYPQALAAINKALELAVIASLLVTSARAGDHVPFVEPVSMLSGALLADSFDGTHLNANLWWRPNWMVQNDPYISVGVENGRLLISGLSHPAGTDHQYVGVISKYFRETDVVLVARIRVQSSFEKDGRIQHMVHLCSGDWPDFFTEIIFGRISTGPPRWFAAYVDKIWEHSGYTQYLEPTHAATNAEAQEWHTVVLKHDGLTGETQNYLILDHEWIPIGPPHTLRFNHTHVELKVDVSAVGTSVQMEADDVRLYLNPAHNPVTIVVSSRVVRNRPELPIGNQNVRIVEESAPRLLGESMTDEGGQAKVFLRGDVVYPVAARIEVWDGNREVLRSRISGDGIRGLYPGDVWAVRTDPTFADMRYSLRNHGSTGRLTRRELAVRRIEIPDFQ